MSVSANLKNIINDIPASVKLIAVSKKKSVEHILEAYAAGQRMFGENYIQELTEKYSKLPKDIEWHAIGHLQSNKVKYIAPFVSLIHGVESLKLLTEINKQAIKNNRIINCLLQIHIAEEESKFGFSFEECDALLNSGEINKLQNVSIKGLMGMATNTDDTEKVRKEFRSLKTFFDKLKIYTHQNIALEHLSMGMSNDYKIAIEEGSNMVRIGSLIFGER